MSVVAILTELTEQEISGIVGGGQYSKNSGSSSAKGVNAQSSNQSATVIANGGGKNSDTKATSIQGSNQSIDNSKDRAYVTYKY
ncbi:MAG: hypothetical protein KME49_03735 [Brasilonema octagenarum HA4186-MV1]|jgi:hypothetical protein|uniref:Uncharacterized protein n=1 Tax=Brasilonema sennae CENA114 TaxID=415709 RepID=A0A856MFT3_9CYAN|nr:hypothetical protein [Brasilonema sennae]MBW4624633.1 hypothetical protein [Brasilonema octagenarum HA4186-MV1]QDL08541.1 hypothetical protein DP114_12140 [Brasilonema sennae CENA114]QDL14896.1 hypothetical protein DP113_12075 [Brasilonema octagenarum UFV-E1]